MKRMLLFLLAALPAGGQDVRLEEYAYPFPVRAFPFTSQQQEFEMNYMDVTPEAESRGAVLLLHGKNFSGAYWKETAEALSAAGYRVIMPDQVGFGKSSKPEHYQFSIPQLADNTHALLKHLSVDRVHVLGHSMGGMIATRFALMFPAETASLILANPIGLEDWQAEGVPYQPVDAAYQQELKQTPEKIRAYQQENYYHGTWRPEYDAWVDYLAAFINSPDYPSMAWDQALTHDMIFTQPVCHEFHRVTVPALLIIGQSDRTAIGKDRAPPEVKDRLGHYPELGRKTAALLPNAQLVELDGVGHLPHIEAFPRFIEPLTNFLANATR